VSNASANDGTKARAGTCSTCSFEIRFFLTKSELEEAGLALHPVIANQRINPFLRLFNGMGALMIVAIPHILSTSWRELLKSEPVGTLFLAAVGLVSAWSSSGVGMKALNHHLNRLDLEREISVSEVGVRIRHGNRVLDYPWKRFIFFCETPNLFILRRPGTQFWTIPKRALTPGDEPGLEELLRGKLRRSQPWSYW
jgi:YcxB-like protein